MADQVPAYQIVTRPRKDVRGRKVNGFTASLTGRYGTDVVSFDLPAAATATIARGDVLAALAEYHDQRRAYVFCGDGKTVLALAPVVQGGWAYDIIDADRVGPSSCYMPGCLSREDAIVQATAHADQSYAGVVRVIR